ncbi:hypothetical protein MNEG_14681, partial [Monoraphidium neglectum]
GGALVLRAGRVPTLLLSAAPTFAFMQPRLPSAARTRGAAALRPSLAPLPLQRASSAPLGAAAVGGGARGPAARPRCDQ